MHPGPDFTAGDIITINFEYTVGSAGMKEGGRLRVGLPNPGWGEPLVPQAYFWDCYQKGKDRRYTDYDRVNTTAKIVGSAGKAVPFLKKWPGFREPFGLKKRWLKNYDRWWIEVTLEDDGLDPGDRIIVTYGDPGRKPFTAYVQRSPERKLCFLAFADVEGNNSFEEAEASPWMITVIPGEVARMDITAPSILKEGDVVEILAAYTDAFHVKPIHPPHVDNLSLSGKLYSVPVNARSSSVRFPLPEGLRREASWELNEGVMSIRVVDQDNRLNAVSNPMVMKKSGPRLFWGDLHAQSMYHGWSEEDQLGISCGTPEELYDFARNVAGLDFCAITDSHSICKDIWTEVSEAARKAHKEGEFVVVQGSEIGDNVDGHRNVIFATGHAEPRIDVTDTSPDNLAAMPAHRAQDHYHGRDDVLLVYHHTKVWNNWSRWDPAVESVLEIYSAWGSGEKPGNDLWEVLAEQTGGAQEAWAKGYRLGVIAGSDTHTGTPGRKLAGCERDDMLMYSNGIAGIWAEDLSRSSLFRSLKTRYCYGTTGVKIVVEFYLEDKPMGSEVDWRDEKKQRSFQFFVAGTDTLENVEIVKNNRTAASFKPERDIIHEQWIDTSIASDGDFYYLRIKQRDNNRAWTSPIWLNVFKAG